MGPYFYDVTQKNEIFDHPSPPVTQPSQIQDPLLVTSRFHYKLPQRQTSIMMIKDNIISISTIADTNIHVENNFSNLSHFSFLNNNHVRIGHNSVKTKGTSYFQPDNDIILYVASPFKCIMYNDIFVIQVAHLAGQRSA